MKHEKNQSWNKHSHEETHKTEHVKHGNNCAKHPQKGGNCNKSGGCWSENEETE